MTTMKTKGMLGYLGYGTGTWEACFEPVFKDGYFIRGCRNPHTDEGTAALKKEMQENIGALVIWGGADISPSFYDEKPAVECGAGEIPDRQDMDEARACLLAIELGIPIIGVCRGAQLCCALAGGKLVQHVNGHSQTHDIITYEQETIRTSSVHHQMMWPWGVPHRMLAYCSPNRSDVYVFNDVVRQAKTVHVEPEVIWFPQIKALAIQGHPEFMNVQSRFVEWCNEQVMEFVHPYVLEHTKTEC